MPSTTAILDAITQLLPTMQHDAPNPAGTSTPAFFPLKSLYALIPLLPLLSCILCGVFAALRIKSKLPAWTTVLSLAVSFVLTALMARDLWSGGHAQTGVLHVFDWINFSWATGAGEQTKHFIANFAFYMDPVSTLWMLFVTGLATLIALYASEYMSGDLGAGYCRFFAAFSLFVFSMACLVMADNLVLLYLGWEGVGLCSYLLIGYFYKKPSAVAAAKKAFIVNRIGDLFLALGIWLTYVHLGTVQYSEIFDRIQPYLAAAANGRFDQIPLVVQIIPLLLMGGAFGKSAQFPLYVWLPDAMEGPTPVSALIHAATMVTAGVFLIARTYGLFQLSEIALPIVAWTGGFTALLAATIGMAQFDIKRIMAYSTVSQLGYMFAGLGVLTSGGAVFHVVTHAFFKALLFLCCGAVMHGFAGQLDLRKLSGVMKMKGWLVVGVGMLIGCLNLSGFPGFAGFFSKDMILAEAFSHHGHYQWLGWLLLFTAGLTAYYTFRVFFRVFVGPKYFEPGDELHGHADAAHDAAHDTHGHDPHSHHAKASVEHSGTHPQSEAAEKELADKAHGEHGHGDHHADFHPHAPGWAINTVLATLAVLSIAAAGLYFMGAHGGFVPHLVEQSSANLIHSEHAPEHATLFGQNPHAIMYYVSGVVGLIGIAIAYVLHLQGRTTAATSKADALLPAFGPVAKAVQNKWYVDEFYDFLIRKPLLVLSHIFHTIDQILVDGLVNLAGYLPKGTGKVLRPSQSGELHGYAIGMAGGLAVLLIIILWVART
ncbi:MAG TPA: NADH-quinone oxidoreductase subunit L [Phycisphaerales bacterium]|nr:NADH-quinone oxidoreductase subunit L [Phycisphaerales bacterium]